MGYSVKEIFYTLQGEGARAGRAAVFLRFAGCNLWNGRERDRVNAVCRFCDTDFVGIDGPGGGRFESPVGLAAAVARLWPEAAGGRRYVVCTGGEPLLQLDEPLIACLHDHQFEIAIETNGTLPVPRGVDWICVSPKGTSDVLVRHGDELKFVYPQDDAHPEQFVDLSFEHFFLQPMDGPHVRAATAQAVEYCRRDPRWRLSLQLHKQLGIP